jgi:hypothetical protein
MSKEEIYKLIEIFGFVVDYDQWDVPGKEWIRIKSQDWPKDFGNWPDGKGGDRANSLILYKDDGYETIVEELRMSLINLGGNLRAKDIKKLLMIHI